MTIVANGLDYDRGTGFAYPADEQGCAIGMLRGLAPPAERRFARGDVEVLGHHCRVGYVLYAESVFDKDVRGNRWERTPTGSGKDSHVLKLGVLFPNTPAGEVRRQEYEQLDPGAQVTIKGTLSSSPQVKAKITDPDTGEILERDVSMPGFGRMAIAVDRLDVGDYQAPAVVARGGVKPILSFRGGRMTLDEGGNDFDLYRYCVWKFQGRVLSAAVRAAPQRSYARYGISQTWFTRTPTVLAEGYPLVGWELYVNPLAPPPGGAPQRREGFQALEGLGVGARIRAHNLQFRVDRKLVRGSDGDVALYVSPALETVADKRIAAAGGDRFEVIVEEPGAEPVRIAPLTRTAPPAAADPMEGGPAWDGAAIHEIDPTEIPF